MFHYFNFHELWTIIWGDWNVVQWWAIMTEQQWQSVEVFLLTAWAESFLMLFVDTTIIQGNVFCLVPEKMQKFTEVMESGTKWTHCFVIRLRISSPFTKLTKRISPAADAHELIPFSSYLLMPALIKELNVFCLLAGRIQFIYWGNWPVEPNKLILLW